MIPRRDRRECALEFRFFFGYHIKSSVPCFAARGGRLSLEKTRAVELYDEHRRKVWEDLKSSTENFDKYLLSFSSGALVISLGFIKDVVKPENAVSLEWLLASWIAFLLCILITLASFRASIRALEKMSPLLIAFYLQDEADAFDKHLRDFWTRAVDWCAYLGITFFLVGLICTTVFVNANFRKENSMGKDEIVQKVVVAGDATKAVKPVGMTPLVEGPKPVAMTPVTDGAKPMAMTPAVSGEERAPKPVPMTPVPKPTPAKPDSGNTSQPNQSTKD
jgi:hypothetical protein